MPTVAWYADGNWELTSWQRIELLPTDCIPTNMTLNALIAISWLVSSMVNNMPEPDVKFISMNTYNCGNEKNLSPISRSPHQGSHQFLPNELLHPLLHLINLPRDGGSLVHQHGELPDHQCPHRMGYACRESAHGNINRSPVHQMFIRYNNGEIDIRALRPLCAQLEDRYRDWMRSMGFTAIECGDISAVAHIVWVRQPKPFLVNY